MNLVVLGLNHKTAPVDVRERFSITKEAIRAGLAHLNDYESLNEAVVLSTCNRSEIYAVVDDKEAGLLAMKQFFFDLAGIEEDIEAYLYHFADEACIRHLFDVAASLDSLVLGEGQILSQVKQAYAFSREANATSTVLNTLFHRAIATGKRVRTETRIAYNAVSVSYAAVELARKIFHGDLSHSDVLIFGAGKMAELTAQHLVSRGVRKIYVANRHKDKAQKLAAYFHGEAVAFDRAFNEATDIDVVVTSTGAPHYVVKPWETRQLMTRRKGRPLVFIDIAVPRDVDPEVEDIAGVKLYNIDDLEAVVDENKQARAREAVQAGKIVDEEIAALETRFQYLSCRPLMAHLSERCERIRCRELRRVRAKLPDLTKEERRVIEHMTKMIVRKLLRKPMMRMNCSAGTRQESFYKEAMRRLFMMDGVDEDQMAKTAWSDETEAEEAQQR
jgi:glutamyl-tRNA reductase